MSSERDDDLPEWACEHCRRMNSAAADRCGYDDCQTPRPERRAGERKADVIAAFQLSKMFDPPSCTRCFGRGWVPLPPTGTGRVVGQVRLRNADRGGTRCLSN